MFQSEWKSPFIWDPGEGLCRMIPGEWKAALGSTSPPGFWPFGKLSACSSPTVESFWGLSVFLFKTSSKELWGILTTVQLAKCSYCTSSKALKFSRPSKLTDWMWTQLTTPVKVMLNFGCWKIAAGNEIKTFNTSKLIKLGSHTWGVMLV